MVGVSGMERAAVIIVLACWCCSVGWFRGLGLGGLGGMIDWWTGGRGGRWSWNRVRGGRQELQRIGIRECGECRGRWREERKDDGAMARLGGGCGEGGREGRHGLRGMMRGFRGGKGLLGGVRSARGPWPAGRMLRERRRG